jgi:hypothetical protein
MSNDRDTELGETLAEVGRRIGHAVTDAVERLRSAYAALADVANRPEVRAVSEWTAAALRRRPCLCLCTKAHPDDRDICEMLDAVITGRAYSDWIGEVNVPLCAPCAAARAVHHFG